MTRTRHSIGGVAWSSRPCTPRSTEIFSTRAPSVVHAQEEDVGPGAVRQVEPDRGPFDQDREERVLGLPGQQPGVDPKRMLVDPADAEHPAVALAAPDRPSDLVGQGLEGDLVI